MRRMGSLAKVRCLERGCLQAHPFPALHCFSLRRWIGLLVS